MKTDAMIDEVAAYVVKLVQEAIKREMIVIGDEFHGYRRPTDAVWQRMPGERHKTVVIEAAPEGEDT